MVKDNVVQEFDAQGFSCSFQLFGHCDVVLAGDEPSSGMVVGDDDGWCVIRKIVLLLFRLVISILNKCYSAFPRP